MSRFSVNNEQQQYSRGDLLATLVPLIEAISGGGGGGGGGGALEATQVQVLTSLLDVHTGNTAISVLSRLLSGQVNQSSLTAQTNNTLNGVINLLNNTLPHITDNSYLGSKEATQLSVVSLLQNILTAQSGGFVKQETLGFSIGALSNAYFTVPVGAKKAMLVNRSAGLLYMFANVSSFLYTVSGQVTDSAGNVSTKSMLSVNNSAVVSDINSLRSFNVYNSLSAPSIIDLIFY